MPRTTYDLGQLSKLDKRQLKFLKAENERTAVIDAGEFLIDSALRLVSNPMVAMVGGVLIIDKAYKATNPLSWIDKKTIEAAIVGSTMLESLAKSGALEAMLKTGAETSQKAGTIVKDVLPLLLAGGAL